MTIRSGRLPLMSVDAPWVEVWREVAARLRRHRVAGRGHLLTEDVLRLETVLVLGEFDVRPERMVQEYFPPHLAGGKVDLVIDAPDGVVIEFKYPRDSRTGFSPDTMTLGELLRDFVRVASVPADQRWVVQVIGNRLARYLQGVQVRHALQWATTPDSEFSVSASALIALPGTARQALGVMPAGTAITGRCVIAEPVDETLTLYAYIVAGAAAVAQHAPTSGATGVAPPTRQVAPVPVPAAGGARGEILEAIKAVTLRSGREVFDITDVVQEMVRRGSRYAESTVRTMVTSHMCLTSMGAGSDKHADLERVGRGLYRLARNGGP